MLRIEFSTTFMKASKSSLTIQRVKEIKKIVASTTATTSSHQNVLEYKSIMSSHQIFT